MTDVRLRQLTIKTGVVKRLTKEKIVYEREAEQQRTRITKLTNEGKDEYVLRKEEEVLQECMMMVPDCQRRLAKAYDELNIFLTSEKDLSEAKEYVTAKAIIEEAKPQLPK